MTIDFWDCNCCIGSPMRAVYKPAPTASDLVQAMDLAGIGKALVWHVAQFDLCAQDGNALTAQAVAERDRLLGCWAILPPVTGEIEIEGFFDRMKANRIAALRAFPEQHRFLLNRVVLGPFLDEVAQRRIPLLFSIERGTNWPAVYALLQDFPNLACVLCDIGTWGQDRHTWPLLDLYNNVYVETSYLGLEAGGIAATVNRFGADRLLFGTGFPLRYPEASMLPLLHADMSDEDKYKIGGQNLNRLIQEARL
jgi:predicted TIM-barrel fold metal-dependent hydrolase